MTTSPPEYPHAYQLYGFHIIADREIPGLWRFQGGEIPNGQVSIDFEPTKDVPIIADLLYQSPAMTQQGPPYLQVWRLADEHGLCLRHFGGIRGWVDFLVKENGRCVEIHQREPVADTNVVAYLLGPVIGCALRQQDILALHAGAVVIAGRTVAVIGDKGAGKSTLIAQLAYQGHPILSDDIAPLNQNESDIIVQPGYPRLRLWQTTINSLNIPNSLDFPPVLNDFEKRYLDLNKDYHGRRFHFQSQPVPLAAVFVLAPRESEKTVRIEHLEPKEAMVHVTAHTYAPYVLNDDMRAREFFKVGTLLQKIPVFRVFRPEGLTEVVATAKKITELVTG